MHWYSTMSVAWVALWVSTALSYAIVFTTADFKVPDSFRNSLEASTLNYDKQTSPKSKVRFLSPCITNSPYFWEALFWCLNLKSFEEFVGALVEIRNHIAHPTTASLLMSAIMSSNTPYFRVNCGWLILSNIVKCSGLDHRISCMKSYSSSIDNLGYIFWRYKKFKIIVCLV